MRGFWVEEKGLLGEVEISVYCVGVLTVTDTVQMPLLFSSCCAVVHEHSMCTWTHWLRGEMIPLSLKWLGLLLNYHHTQSRKTQAQGFSSPLCPLQLIHRLQKLRTDNASEIKAIRGWKEREWRCKTSCACVANRSWPGYVVAVGVLVASRPHKGAESSSVPLLDITLLSLSSLLLFLFPSLCVSASVSRFLSPSLFIWITRFFHFPLSSYLSLRWSPSSFIPPFIYPPPHPPHTHHVSPQHYPTNSR